MMWGANNSTKRAEYSTFSVGDYSSDYELSIGGYSSSSSSSWRAEDDFSSHNGFKFSTHDKTTPDQIRRGDGGGW